MNRDDYILKPSDCYDYKAMARTNQQVNKVFDDLKAVVCKNCEYYCSEENNEPNGFAWCGWHERTSDDYRYCSEFEVKDKS